jgi:DNA gyrase subunit B
MSDPIDVTKAIRKRPGMYVEDTEDGRGLHNLVELLIADALDAECSRIAVTLHADQSVTVEDNGRDEPVRLDQLPSLRGHEGPAVTRRRTPWTGYTGGLFVDGGIVVTAMSDWLELEVCGNGTTYHQRCIEGAPVAEQERADPRNARGTRITFHPDPQLFRNVLELSFDQVEARLRDLAYLHRGLQTRLVDERTGRAVEFLSERGIEAYVSELTANEAATSDVIGISGEHERVTVEVAMQWTEARNGRLLCFTNSIWNAGGGTHLAGFFRAVTTVFETIARSSTSNAGAAIDGARLREGLTAVISVRCPEPRYSNMRKDVLVAPDAEVAVATVVCDRLTEYFAPRPQLAHTILARAGVTFPNC